MKISLQIYTLRDSASTDFEETLKKVSEYGYDAIELAGWPDIDVNSLKAMLEKYNLKVSGAHLLYDEIYNNFDKCCKNAKLLGFNSLIIPWYDAKEFDSDKITQTAQKFNELYGRLEAEGLYLGYHNHDFEFANGRFDRLCELCPELKLEIDTYWVAFAGEDPFKYLDKYSSRIVFIHLKDMQKNVTNAALPNPNILEGCMDIKGLMKKAEELGNAYVVVEMDACIGDPLDAVNQSRKNLGTIGY